MTSHRFDLRDAAAHTLFKEFQALPFVEKRGGGLSPRLTDEGLEVRLRLSSKLYTEAAKFLEAGKFVEFLLPENLPCPPTGEALMLAFAQRKLLQDVSHKTDTHPHPHASRWLQLSLEERRISLTEALAVLSGSRGWRDSRWGEIPVVAPNQVAIILPCIRGSNTSVQGLAELTNAIYTLMPKAQVTEWAVDEGRHTPKATLERLEGPPGALIVVAHWDGAVEGNKPDYSPDEIKLGLTLGEGPQALITASALFEAIQGVWPSSPRVLEFATCHGWRLAKAWNRQYPNTRSFGYPGLRNTELVMHSIVDLAVAAFGEPLHENQITALGKVHNVHHAQRVLPTDLRTRLTYEVMRDLHIALWSIPKYTTLNGEDPTHELQRRDDVLAGRRGTATGDPPR